MDELWEMLREKLRWFLLFWAAVAAVLVIAALVVHGGELLAALAGSVRAVLATVISFGIWTAIVVLVLRSLLGGGRRF